MTALRAIHWFRNDLRLRDNTTLAALAEAAEAWAPVFVVDDRFVTRDASLPRVRFLFDCVRRLRDDLARRGVELDVRVGRPERVLPSLARASEVELVSFGEADTPLGRRRDEGVARALERVGVGTLVVRDHTVFGPDEILTGQGGHYAVFTPYRNAWWRAWDAAPRHAIRRIAMPASTFALDGKTGQTAADPIAEAIESRIPLPTGGEAAARRRLARFLETAVARYAADRDVPAVDGTSRLSPYLRFGAISPRTCLDEALAHAEANPRSREAVQKWLDELVWREFYATILHTSPRSLSHNHRPEYDALEWKGTDAEFEAWCAGVTGYPIVDAGMRQLRETGWMHNRVRMVVASFLTKDLLIDWRRGARHFFAALVDGDPASNAGGWQWAASTGTDAQPYFRIFNPVSQGKKCDPDGDYVRRWVPELREVETRHVHSPWLAPTPPGDYPAPIVDHKTARERALAEFRRARAVGGT